MRKIKDPLPAPETPEEIESHALTLESPSLLAEIEEKFDSSVIAKLKKISFGISNVGLSISESCTLSNVDYEEFKELMGNEPLIAKVIRIKELEYKKGLMNTVSARARGGDDKLAQWLLERRFPDEFAIGKNRPQDDGQNMIFEAIQFIQSSGDRTPLIQESNGRAIAVRVSSSRDANGNQKELRERIMDVKKMLA